jgi:hypothetical protein
MFCILSNVDVYRLYHVLLRIHSLPEWGIIIIIIIVAAVAVVIREFGYDGEGWIRTLIRNELSGCIKSG